MRVITWFLAAALWVVPAQALAASFHLDGAAHRIGIAEAAEALPDPDGRLTIEEADRAAFVPAASLPAVAEGIHPRATWFRVRLERGRSVSPWVLHFFYKITRLEMWVKRDGIFVYRTAGYDRGRSDDAFVAGYLTIPEDALHGAPFYLRVWSVNDPRALRIEQLETSISSALQRRVFFGFFVSFFLAIGAFNLLLFIALRERPLLNFAGVMALFAARVYITSGGLWLWIPPITFLQRELIFDSVALGASAALTAFAIAFLRLSDLDRRWRNGLIALTALLIVAVFGVDFWPSADQAFYTTFAASVLYYGGLTLAGVRAQRLGMRYARFFTAALAVVTVGYILNMLSDHLPFYELWVFTIDAGYAVCSLFIALAVMEQVQDTRLRHAELLATARNLQELAMRDALTGVLNRRAFDEALQAAWNSAASSAATVGVLLIDIDHFKSFNDRFGHQQGDECLRVIAGACAACTRDNDIFARYGGEEFACVIADATSAELERIAERMRAAVWALGLEGAGPSHEFVSISVGGACCNPSATEGAGELVRRADAALYRAKNEGRNRTILAA